MENELIIYDQKPLTAKDIRAQVNLIQEVMKSVMIDGTHYGKIPGCGDKPTLLKPGAEKLIATFNLCPEIEIIDLSNEDIIRYRIICHLKTMSGKFVGDGVGECSSEEDKYKWRKIVSEEEWNAWAEDEKRIKFYKEYSQKQVRTNPADLANTILKMAKKRALVDATLTRTAASDIFTQDIEDMPEELIDKDKGKPKPPPKSQEEKPPEEKQKGIILNPEQSKLYLAEVKKHLDKCENLFNLRNSYKKHYHEWESNLLPEDMIEVQKYKDKLKEKYEKT